MKDYEKIYIDETLKENYHKLYEFLTNLDIKFISVPLSGELAIKIICNNKNDQYDDLEYGVFYHNCKGNSEPFNIWIQDYELNAKTPLLLLDFSGLEKLEHKSYEKDFDNYYRYVGKFIIKLTEKVFKSNKIPYSITRGKNPYNERTLVIERVQQS